MPWRPRMNRNPSAIERSPGRVACSADGCGERAHAAMTATAKLTTSIQYTKLMPAPASRMPPSAGPTIVPSWLSTWFMAEVVAMCSGETRLGTIALRVGLSNAVRPAVTAGRTNSGQRRAPRSALRARPPLQHPISTSTRSSSFRRSVASITVPLYSEQISSGIS